MMRNNCIVDVSTGCDFNDDNGLACYYASFWFETCRTTLDLLRETLSLDIVSEDNTIQTGGSRVNDEAGPSTRHHKRHR
jgi:hypothetical protein